MRERRESVNYELRGGHRAHPSHNKVDLPLADTARPVGRASEFGCQSHPGRLLSAGRIDRHRRCISSLVMIDIVWRVTRRVRRNATCQESAPARGGERPTPHLISSFSLSGRAGSVALRSEASCALLTLQPLRAPVMALDLSMRT